MLKNVLRMLGLWAVLCSSIVAADDGSLLLGGVLNFAPIVVPGFSTWFPGLNTAQIAYSNGNNTATCCVTFASTYATYGNRGHGTGKWYAEFNITNIGNTCCTTIGLVNLSFVPAEFSVPGGQNTGVGYNVSSGMFFYQGSSFASGGPTATTGNVVGLALDIANKNVWIVACTPSCGNWNNSVTANPATNTGGYSISMFIAAWAAGYPMYLAESGGFANNEAVTLNTGGTTFSQTIPSGFSTWH